MTQDVGGLKSSEKPLRIPIRARPFVFICGVLIFGLTTVISLNALRDGSGGAFPMVFGASLVFVLVCAYVLIRDMITDRVITIAVTHLEMPATLMRRGMQRVEYTDILGIEIATIKLNRMLQVRTKARRYSVMDNEMPRRMSLEDLRDLIADAAEIAIGRKLD